MNQLPVTIIGGYLGAGKTTLINHLLRNAAGKRLAILVNEFGDLAIDEDLIEAEGDELVSLSGGCVCCSYGSGLIDAFLKLEKLDPKPDHIVLEASGVAIPSAIAGSLSLLNDIRLDGIIALVDASQIRTQISNPYLQDTIERQLAETDIILLNKADLVEIDEQEKLVSLLSNMASSAAVIPVEHSKVEPGLALGSHDPQSIQADTDHHVHTITHETQTLQPEVTVDPQQYAQSLLEEIPGLVRAKGFVQDTDGNMKTIHIVGNRIDISQAPEGVKPGVVTIRIKT